MRWVLPVSWKTVNLLIPKNRFGDRALSFLMFLIAHKRFPSDNLIFNDILYKIKTTDEILRPERTFTSDKELVKIYIKDKIGEIYNIHTIAVLKNKEEVFNFKFPSRCVIKPTHSSGKVILRRDGEDLDLQEIVEWLSYNFYDSGREANYKFLTPKIIVEEFVFDSTDIDDIKFFCYKGKVKVIQWDFDRHSNHTRKLYTRDWIDLNTSIGYPLSQKNKDKPKNLNDMIAAAEKLSKDFDFVRIDFYTDETFFCVGEITHVPGNAVGCFIPKQNELLVSNVIFQS